MIPRVEGRRCDASLLAGDSGGLGNPQRHERRCSHFQENERIVNVVQIERVRSTEQSGRYHNNPEKKKEK